jgi:type II secretory pathway component GspD/PulD (secretin)
VYVDVGDDLKDAQTLREMLEKERLAMIATKRKRVCVGAGLAALLAISAGGALGQGLEKHSSSYQTFYLKNATNQNAANDIQTAMRNMIPGAKIYYAATENALSVSGNAEEIAQAQKMLAELDKPQKVYRVTYTISDGHGAPRHLAMLLTPGRTTTAKQGSRVPIMTGSYKEGGGEPSNTQFQYADIGLNVEASIEGYGDGLRLRSKIEETSISEQKSNVGIQDPVIDQSVLDAHSALNAAKPVTLGALDLPDGKHMEVQVSSEIVQ